MCDLIQIDVMDGKFVSGQSFVEVGWLKDLQINAGLELHLMVEDPIKEMEKWSEIKNIKRVIFHIESEGKPDEWINFARGKCWQVGIALNPATELDAVRPWLEKINLVLFMTVVPGRQGAPFVTEVMEKIKEFVKLENRPLCAVDGGVNKDTIGELKKIGVEVFGVGSALAKSPDVARTYKELLNLISL